eukprot:TRINITY_DN6665_c0_g1_i1.p1 TRINITY_DN6665_c0_g1~~TRINITY_DN6665_c0_g1_i1.p1  ORF type:complete len:341 (-),score=105.54 TRINITY_DN6665_c0_g1_i1:24-1046(-)
MILLCSRCSLTPKVCLLDSKFASLEELHLSSNSIKSLAINGEVKLIQGFHNLQLLNLERNELCDWNQIQQLSALPKLSKLILSGNLLKEIKDQVQAEEKKKELKEGSFGCPQGSFDNLKSILLDENLINDWVSINALNSFPSLTQLRINGNPLLQNPSSSPSPPVSSSAGAPSSYSYLVRNVIIAVLKKLTLINGSQIDLEEREEAEKVLLRYYNTVSLPASIVEQLGYSINSTSSTSKTQSTSLSSDILKIKIRNKLGAGDEIERSLPRSTPLAAIRQLCIRSFKIQTDTNFTLFCAERSTSAPSLKKKEMSHLIAMTDLTQPLSFYIWDDNFEIVVDF